MSLQDRWVHFRIRDVYLPEPQELLSTLHGDDLLQGRVIEVSESGAAPQSYVVVEVEGVEHPLIVPVSRVLGAL